MDSCSCPDYQLSRRSVLSERPHRDEAGLYVFERRCYWCGARMADNPLLDDGVSNRWRGRHALDGQALARMRAVLQEKLGGRR